MPDTSTGGETLRTKDRIYKDESGYVAGYDTKEAGEHELLGECNPIEAAAAGIVAS